MSWGEIKKAINSDLSTPLDLAPIADAQGDKYYPVFTKDYGFERVKDGVSRAFNTDIGIDPITSSSGNRENIFFHEKGIYVVDKDCIRRVDKTSLTDIAVSETITSNFINRNYIFGDSIYVYCNKSSSYGFRKYSLETLELEAESNTTASYQSDACHITPNGIYMRYAETFYRYSLENLTTLATYSISSNLRTDYPASAGFAVGGGYLTIMGTRNSSSIARIVLRDDNLQVVVSNVTTTLLLWNDTYSAPAVLACNEYGFIITCSYKANGSGTEGKIFAFISHIEKNITSESTPTFLRSLVKAEVNSVNQYRDHNGVNLTLKASGASYVTGYHCIQGSETVMGAWLSKNIRSTGEYFYLYNSDDPATRLLSVEVVAYLGKTTKLVYRDHSGVISSSGAVYEAPNLGYPLFATLTDLYFRNDTCLIRVPILQKIAGYKKREG